jgi:peptidoglycan/LPS O-acetylase OafA/YrhL
MDTISATSTNATAPGKNHYVILDGLRGVAALFVVAFHLFEAYAGNNPQKQIINHGYLAVDFFFLLSGFVVAYAYDDRWDRMSVLGFFKRRLIRLQPMVVMGSVIGAALFAFQDYSIFPKYGNSSLSHVGMGRDIPAERSGMVAVLRICCQCSVCLGLAQAV